MNLILFRTDLRINDNPALSNAAKTNKPLIALYIHNTTNTYWPIGSASKYFLHHALLSLKNDLKKQYNLDLIIKSGDSKLILSQIVEKYEINEIFWNRNYEPKLISLDKEIKTHFESKNIKVNSSNAKLLFEPWKIKNLSGSYFKVFTPFWKNCLSKLNQIKPPLLSPNNITPLNHNEKSDNLALLPHKPNWSKGWDKIWQISETNANKMADIFIKEKISNYKNARDIPSIKGTSLLSSFLHFGLISPNQILAKTNSLEPNTQISTFLSEIGWREFSYHLLFHNPNLPEQNWKPKFDNFQWENNENLFTSWKTGQTGYPIIDAGMRELWQTGYMHNRVRMITASFLIKNLLIDWRKGQEWFWDCLIDADLAANSASWQWVAGSGADASPYFRVFNPVLQSQKFDSQGEYIKKWVPELTHLTPKQIHTPWTHNLNLENYPKPIIDLKKSREKALNLYKKLN